MTNLARNLRVNDHDYRVVSLAAAVRTQDPLDKLPFCLRILLENALRHAGDAAAASSVIDRFATWRRNGGCDGGEIEFRPSRILTPESGGLPLLADLAAMRDAAARWGCDSAAINPLIPVDLVVDHSLIVEEAGTFEARARNESIEMTRNAERFAFLKWAQQAFKNVRVIPPGFGICHQVNVEYLARVVQVVEAPGSLPALVPDTLIGLDSHTPTVNALGVVGWGVGGIEAAAALMGEPMNVCLPRVIGCRLSGRPPRGFMATDLAFRVVEVLRKVGVVGDFVEFFGPGVRALSVQDRATVANMTPEYGATMGFFPCDEKTLAQLAAYSREADHIALVREYLAYQGLLALPSKANEPEFSQVVDIDLGNLGPCIAGPRRPHERLNLADAAASAKVEIAKLSGSPTPEGKATGEARNEAPRNGMVAIAALASCTNTVNARSVFAAALLAKNAVARGLSIKPWVKTSMTLGSPVLAKALAESGLSGDLSALGFHLAGFGCATCLGNSGPLKPATADAIRDKGLAAWAVVSSNRNFEGRIHPLCRYGYLASPPLVVAYALAGSVTQDLTAEPLGTDGHGNPVYMADIWPDDGELAAFESRFVAADLFRDCYAKVHEGKSAWENLASPNGERFAWPQNSTYLKEPPFFAAVPRAPSEVSDILGARALLILGDGITTDHISPIGAISSDSVAGVYLRAQSVEPADFNSFASRRVNHEVMVRGTFGSPRLNNELVPERNGEFTLLVPGGTVKTVFDAAAELRASETPIIIVAGKNYGMGSSRDWAAKGTHLLGIRAVIAEDFERIHRANLVCMGVLPLEFTAGENRHTLGLVGDEAFDLTGLDSGLRPRGIIRCSIRSSAKSAREIMLKMRVETEAEVAYIRHGGILPYILRTFASRNRSA